MPTAISIWLISILAGAVGNGGAPDRYRLPVGVVNSAVCLHFSSIPDSTAQPATSLT